MHDLLLLFIISATFVGAALIRRGHLLEGGTYKIFLASGGALIRGRHLFEARH